MLASIASLLTKSRTLHAVLELDHVELASDQIVLGLRVTWRNDMLSPLEIQEVSVDLFNKGKQENPTSLTYNARFARIPYQKAITKIAGANTFAIQAGSTRTEYLRFVTREILDLADGKYAAELHSTVADGTYVHEFNLKVAPQFKIRAAAPEGETSPNGTSTTSIIARARRIVPG